MEHYWHLRYLLLLLFLLFLLTICRDWIQQELWPMSHCWMFTFFKIKRQKKLFSTFFYFPGWIESIPNRDPKTEVQTELWILCTVTPLVSTTVPNTEPLLSLCILTRRGRGSTLLQKGLAVKPTSDEVPTSTHIYTHTHTHTFTQLKARDNCEMQPWSTS